MDPYADRGAGFNVFWANVETQKSALYARTPKPQVERKFKDADPVGRRASDTLERALSYTIREYDFDSVVKLGRDDFLRIGRGQAWVRYVPHFEGETVVYEEVRCEYVHWDDFLHDPARTWDEVRWVGRRIYMSRAEIKKRFGDDVAEGIQLNHLPRNVVEEKDGDSEGMKRAEIFEIWDKESRTVYWVSSGFKDRLLDSKPDPLGLRGFFPCPRPIYATTTSDSLIPIADYAQYQDQARELDEVTQRIGVLTEALQVCGVYDEACEGVSDLLSTHRTNKLIPVKNWPAFAQQGGLQGAVQFMPLGDVIAALQALYERQAALKAEIFEITGISDIVRGNSNPNETATAQQLKGQFATLRITDRQQDIQRFVRDILDIKGEIIAEHFQPETLAMLTGTDPGDPEFQQAMQLLRDDKMRSFRIDIETDSTIALNESQDKQDANEFVQVVGGFLSNVAQTPPALAPVMSEVLMFLARRFHAGRSLEGALEQYVEQVKQQASQPPQPPPPDPAMMKAQADQQMAMQRLQLDQAKVSADIQFRQQEAQAMMQAKAVEEDRRAQVEIEKAKINQATEIEKARHQSILAAQEAEAMRGIEVQKILMQKYSTDKEHESRAADRLYAKPEPAAQPVQPAQPPIEISLNLAQPGKRRVTSSLDALGNKSYEVSDAP